MPNCLRMPSMVSMSGSYGEVMLKLNPDLSSGIISVNGAAAHKANPADVIIICTYAVLSQQEAAAFKPTLVYLDEDNRIKDTRHAIPVQVA